MKKAILYAILVSIAVLTGCGKAEEVKEESKQVKIEEEQKTMDKEVVSNSEDSSATEDSQDTTEPTIVEEPDIGNNTGSNEETTKQNNGSTNNTQKPATNDTSNNTNNNNQNSNTTTTQPSTGETTTQPVHEHNWTEVTEDEIHYYAWRTICNVCKTDMTDMTADEMTYHVAVVCGGSYANYYKEVDFVTENIVKTPVVTGYKCECGAEK